MKQDRTLEALLILRNKKPATYRQFAELFWPDSDMHKRVYNTGYGATEGKGAWLCAGSFIGKLEKRGLVHKTDFVERFGIAYLTEQGVQYITEHSPSPNSETK